jgi:hypothetical protein
VGDIDLNQATAHNYFDEKKKQSKLKKKNLFIGFSLHKQFENM